MLSGDPLAPQLCPKCKLVNHSSAQRCDCGYDFVTGTMQQSYEGARPHLRLTHSVAIASALCLLEGASFALVALIGLLLAVVHGPRTGSRFVGLLITALLAAAFWIGGARLRRGLASGFGPASAAAILTIMVGFFPLPNQSELFDMEWPTQIINALIVAALIASRGHVARQ